MTIVEKIGLPALYEQLAEECTELAQAALKLARIKRGENPARMTGIEARAKFLEEVADVELCLELIPEEICDGEIITMIKEQKLDRWKRHLKIDKKR